MTLFSHKQDRPPRAGGHIFAERLEREENGPNKDARKRINVA
jgi:hypothetical protein